MITIQTVMLVALGFLAATLCALMFAPAYRARTVRLTTDRLRKSMPLTEAEIRADKDRIKTQYALRVHELETQLEKGDLSAARQRVELNRRDATISGLRSEISEIRVELEQHVNARRVLEQTVVERVPAIEQRLSETKALLYQRDRELAAISSETGRTVRALDETMQANAQQRAEIDRLTAIVGARPIRSRERLMKEAEDVVAGASDGADPGSPLAATSGIAKPAEAAADAARGTGKANGAAATRAAQDEIEALTAASSEQAAKIRRLEAAIAAYEEGEGSRASIKGSKLAMKARIASLQSEVESQAATIQKLRAEAASANERFAQQSSQFLEEMRRLGAGTMPVTTQPRRSGSASARRNLADRIGEQSSPVADRLSAPGARLAGMAGDGHKSSESSKAGVGESSGAASSKRQESAAKDTEERVSVSSADAGGESRKSAEKAADTKPKSRLMDRIAGLTET